MKAAAFDYHAPTTVEEAVGLLADLGEDAKVLAGGQSLIPMMALRLASFSDLVDLGRVDGLRGSTRDGDVLRVGAMTTQAALLDDGSAMAAVPMLAAALPLIGHFQIRNRGTVGGSVAHADPASELPAVALALGAELEVAGPGGTTMVPATAFFEGTWTTSLAPDQVLAAIRFPMWSGRCGFAVEEVARRHGDFAIAGAAVGVQLDGDTVKRAAVGLFGVGSTPLRSAPAEEAALSGAAPAEVGRAAAADLDPPGDIHGSSAYRKHVVAALVERAVRRATEEAKRG